MSETNGFFAIMLLSVLCACNRVGSNNQVNEGADDVRVFSAELKFLMTKDYPLDEYTIPFINYLQYFEESSEQERIAFMDVNSGDIYIHDYDSGHRVRRIELPSTVRKAQPQGFCIYAPDSLLVYSYYTLTTFNVVLDGDEPEDVRRFRVAADEKKSVKPIPWTGTATPIKKNGDVVTYIGFIVGELPAKYEAQRTVLTFCDMKTGELKTALGYPEIYRKGNWEGGFFFRLPYYDMDAENRIVVSFPASELLYIYHPDTGVTETAMARSVDGSGAVPISENKDEEFKHEELRAWYNVQLSYDSILYDKYREVYYRFVRHPAPGSKDHGINTKPVSVIILDKDLKVIGETFLPEDVYYRPGSAFVSSAGLNIQIITNDEDKLLFQVYELAEN